MASSYDNDLRLNELGTGDASGTWGTVTNLNLSNIGQALSFDTQDCFSSDADATTTVGDGIADPARAIFFKVTSSATLTATRTLTIAPNTVSRLQFIENATTGSQSITISQGSGANITIPTGQTKAVYLDGAGSGAAVVDAFTDLNIPSLIAGGLTFPTSDGSADQFLKTNGSGTLSFATPTTKLDDIATGDAESTLATSSGDIILDSADEIDLDANGGVVRLVEAGSRAGTISSTTTLGVLIDVETSDKFFMITGDDGGSSITALTISMANAGAASFNGAITANAGVNVDNITIDGTEIDLSSGDLTIDVAGDIILDADGADIKLADDGTVFGELKNESSYFVLKNPIQDQDVQIKGNDGGSEITAMSLDMSAAGAATFNNDVTAFSDKRLKTDISNIENGIEKVMQMQGVHYKRNDIEDAKPQIGVLAQDMEAIVPEIVLTADDEMQTKSVDYGKLTAVLIEAIKDLKAEIDELKGR